MQKPKSVGCIHRSLPVPSPRFTQGGQRLAPGQDGGCEEGEENDGDDMIEASHGGFYRSIQALNTTRGSESSENGYLLHTIGSVT